MTNKIADAYKMRRLCDNNASSYYYKKYRNKRDYKVSHKRNSANCFYNRLIVY